MSNTFKIVLIILIAMAVISATMAVIGFVGKEREYMKRIVVEDKLALALKEKKSMERDLESAKTAKKDSEDKIIKMEEKVKDISSQLDEIKQKGETAIAELEIKKTELAKIKIELDNEKKEKLNISKKLDTIQSDYDKIKKDAARLTNENMDLEKKIAELQEKQSINLDKIVVNSGDEDASSQAVKPLMEGKILVVNKEYNFIVSDIGQDKGIQKGAKFDVMDGSRFLGQAEIDKVYDTMSSATILPGGKINDMKKGNVIIESR